MKKTNIVSIVLTTLLAFSIIFIACQKSSNDPAGNSDDQVAASLNASASAEGTADNAYNDVVDNVMGVNAQVGIGTGIGVFGKHSMTGKEESDPCFTVTITPETEGVFPKTVVIDFGEGCTGKDGLTRKGKISIVYTNCLIVPGSSATATFDGFYVDEVHVEGTLTIQNNSSGNDRIFTVTVQDGKLTWPNGDYILHNKTKTWTQIDGKGTPAYPLDDVFSITGNGSGTVKHGETTTQWTSEITEPLIRRFTCRWIVKGSVHITRNEKEGVLDFGNGDCDNKAALTAYGKVYDITLP